MARLTFREIKPLKFREVVPDTAPDEPQKFPSLGDLFTAPAAPPPEPEIPFGATAVQRAGRIDELTPPTPTPEPPPSFGATAIQRAARIDELERAESKRKKGPGFLGTLERPDGDVSTELSIGVKIGGKETEIPSLVPTLTREEADTLLTITDPKDIPPGIVKKARSHAEQRIQMGLSPFYDPDEEPELSTWDYVKGRWRVGTTQVQIAQLRKQKLLGDDSPELEARTQALKDSMPNIRDDEGRALPIRAIGAAADMVPMQIAAISKGLERGMKLGAGAAAITAVAGQAGPQAALPEEIITVPAAAAGMFGVGMYSGTLEEVGWIEAGMAYDELLDLRDPEGNALDPRIAKSAASAVGVINGLIELAQIRLLLKTIPGGRRLLNGLIKDTTQKALTSGLLKDVVFRNAAKYGAFITAETGQEVLQETTNILATELATQLNNHLIGTDLPKQTREEIVDRLLETAQQSAMAFAVTGLPGTTATTSLEAVRQRKRPLTFEEVPPTPPVAPEAAPEDRGGEPAYEEEVAREMAEEVPPAMPTEVEPAPTEVEGPKEPIISKDATPFQTERGAKANIAKAQKQYPGIKDWTVVPVRDGFALMPRHEVVWQQPLQEYTERFYLNGRMLEDVPEAELEVLGQQPGMYGFVVTAQAAGGDLRQGIGDFIADRVEIVREMKGVVRRELARKKLSGQPRTSTITAKHYREVKKAIKAGLPVPDEVLADYPDLKEGVEPPVIPVAKMEPPEFNVGETVQTPVGVGEIVGISPTRATVNIDGTIENVATEDLGAVEAEPIEFTTGDTVQTPFGEGKITSIGTTNAIVRLVDGTTEAFDLGDISTPVAQEEAEIVAEEPEVEIEPKPPVEAEAPIVEAPAPVLGKDKRGKPISVGDHVEYDQYPGERFEIVRALSEDRPDIMKVRKVGQKRQYNAHVSRIRKIIPTVVKPARGPQRTWKTLVGWFKLNPIWDKELTGETNQFHVRQSGVPGLVSKARGLPWDELAMKAKEDGILRKDQDWQDLAEMLRVELQRLAAGKPARPIGDITAYEKQIDKEAQQAEAEWIAEVQTKIQDVSYNDIDSQAALAVGDKLHTPTAQGDSHWIEVTKVNKDGSVEVTDPRGEKDTLALFDWVELVGGIDFGVDRVADRPESKRVALKLEKKQRIPVLNKYENQLIRKMNKEVKGKYPDTATVNLPQEAVDLIDPELWLSSEVQLEYGMGSSYDKVGWAIQLIQGNELGDRVYIVERPYGQLTFDLNAKTLRLDPKYEGIISESLIVDVDPDMEKERVLRTTLMVNVMKQNPTRTIPNELLQNSLDAMPDARPWDQQVITWRVEGKYDGEKDSRETVISVEDNASGMAPAVFAFKYLKIGAEGKRSTIAKGGYGAANSALLYFPNNVDVVSVGWAVENEEYTTRMVKGEERVDLRRWEDGRNEDGTVKEGAIKIRTTLKATQDEMFDGLAGRKSVPLKIDLPGDFDPDTPTGTTYKATYSNTDEKDRLEISDWALRSGFQNYVNQLRHKAVVIQQAPHGDPDVVTHTKSFDDLKPEELKEPKIILHSKGNEIEIFLLDVGPTGAYKGYSGYDIAQKFYNKGLPLQIREDNIGGIKKVPFEPDFKILINFRLTPDVDPKKRPKGHEYPFIENRTEVLNKVGDQIAAEVNTILDVMIKDFNTGELKDFKQMEKQSPTNLGVTTMIPYRSEEDVKAAKALLKKHKPLFREFSKAFNVFQDLMTEIGQDKINLVLTIDKRLHGWKSNPDFEIPELYAINPFSVTKRYLEKDAFQKALAAGVDADAAKAYNFAYTMMHEYSHKHVSGHGQPFRSAMGDLFALFGPLRYAILGRELYGIFKKHSKRIEQLTQDFDSLGEGGLLLTTQSGRNKYGQHERGRIKGTSPYSEVSGVFAQSRIQYDLFGEHQKIEGELETPVNPEDFLKRSFPDASPAQIKAMLEDPKLRKQVAQGNISTELADQVAKKYNLARQYTQKEMFPGEAKGQGDLFDLNRVDLGEGVDNYAEDLGPEAGALVFKAKAKPLGEAFESSDEEVQRRVEQARGAPKDNLYTVFKNKMESLKNRAFRTYEHLPKTKEFAELQNALLRLQKGKGYASRKTQQKLKSIMKGLNITDEIDFTWKAILDDLVEEVALQRERGTAEDDIGLPYGYTPESLAKDHADLNKHIQGNTEIEAALKRRQEMWDVLREEYTRAMKVIGFDVGKHLTRDFYFRHQILAYTNVMGLFGTGERLRTPTYRSHLRPRTGSSSDINADYLQAENEVVAQMYYDIEIARTIQVVDRFYNIQDELKGQALAINDREMLKFFEQLIHTFDVPEGKEPPTAESLYKSILNKKMAIGFDKLGQLAAGQELPTGENYEWEWLVIDLADNWLENKAKKKDLGKEWTSAARVSLNNEAADSLIKYAAWILKNHGGEPGSGAAATIFKGMNEKRKIMQETLGKEYVSWRDLIPEGYTTWQPWEGTTFFMAHSVPETIAKQLLEDELLKLGIKADDLRQGLMRGGRRREYVVKQEIADTLNELSKPQKRSTLGRVHAWHIKRWKIWQLVSPRRFAKYNFRNLTGDADATFVGSPAIFKHTRTAFNELYQVFVEGKDPAEDSEDLNDWLDRGGWGATLQAQEMGEFDVTKPFLRRHEKTGITGIPRKAWDAYWQTARVSTDFREALLRYAAYKEAMKVMKEAPDGLPKDYWASIRQEIQGLSDIKDRAYFMSNDLLGAYDRVSVMGQELRERYFPFWSWKAVNFVRYVRLVQNAAHNGELTKKLGYKAVGTAARTPFIAMRIGKLILKASALYAVTMAINGGLFPREEDDLPEEIKGRPHLVFGRDADGNVQYFPRIGALADNLEWFGLDASPYYVNQLMRGRMTLMEIAHDMAKSPANVILQGSVPFIKLLYETVTRRALFPDAFEPRTVRDRLLHVARGFGLENEYKAIAGIPSKPYIESAKGLVIYTIDPFQAAYRDTLDQKTRFMKRIGKHSTGFYLSDRGQSLYNARLAMRYDDYEATIKYMAEYLNHGGTLRGIKQSLEGMNPLSELNANEKIAFVASLDAEGLAKFVRALRFWEELVTVPPPEEKRALRLLK